ncbi:carotenoid cleavage dioxygenase [Paraphoma chrysanthemicola]|nr:carotenoid cleavage dioxygenase [Paraphoma chrysanthemicola]
MTRSKLTPFSLDQQMPMLLDEEDVRAATLLNAQEHNRTSVYNVAGYQPIHEELSHIPVEISGTLPLDLEGTYLRNGTNIQFTPNNIRLHAFAGAAMVHQIQISGGKATYSNFYVRTPRFEIERKVGRGMFIEFSDIAGSGAAALAKTESLSRKVKQGLLPAFSQYELTPGSTSVRYHSGHLYCLQETGYAFVLDARCDEKGRLVLDGRGRLETWDGEWEGPFSAHPRFDPITGDMYNLSLDDKSRIVAGHITKGMRHSQESFKQTEGSMGWLHDFFLTENFIVFPDVSMRRDLAGLTKEAGSIFAFDHKYHMRWGVLPRKPKGGDDIRWFSTQKPSTIWHVINAWEETGRNGVQCIKLFSPCFDDYPSDVPIHSPAEPPAKIKTWTLNLDIGSVTDEETLLDHHYERPSINLDYVGRPSRYCYLLDEECDGYMGKGVLKYDMIHKKEVAYLSYGEMYGGEALFVAKENAESEDDGYLLDILMDAQKSDLIVIDALTMKEIARLRLPQRVPFGVHAAWLTSEEVASLVQ